jgi:hypothetical protein
MLALPQAEHTMRRLLPSPLALLLLAACGSRVADSGTGQPSSQQFTREVGTVPGTLVKAAVRTFDRYGIPILEANEPDGRVRTVPVDLRALARRFDEAPVTCPQGTPRETRALFRFEVKIKRVDKGSELALQSAPEGKSGCIMRAAFVSALLDEIARSAGEQ